jgi:putative transcriptional regulator
MAPGSSASTTGRLLIAEPMLGDPNFERSVVLVVEHTDEGALGLVLNHPTQIPVADALPAWADLVTEPSVLYLGGPVDEQTGWCLARAREPSSVDGFAPLLGDLGLVDLSADPALLVADLHAVRVYAGYSGWGPGQLDAELSVDAWFVVDARPDDPFHDSAEDLWAAILARQPAAELRRLSLFPPDPSLN